MKSDLPYRDFKSISLFDIGSHIVTLQGITRPPLYISAATRQLPQLWCVPGPGESTRVIPIEYLEVAEMKLDSVMPCKALSDV